MNIVCPKCHLQPIEPFLKNWKVMTCYCGHQIENKSENRIKSGPSLGTLAHLGIRDGH